MTGFDSLVDHIDQATVALVVWLLNHWASTALTLRILMTTAAAAGLTVSLGVGITAALATRPSRRPMIVAIVSGAAGFLTAIILHTSLIDWTKDHAVPFIRHHGSLLDLAALLLAIAAALVGLSRRAPTRVRRARSPASMAAEDALLIAVGRDGAVADRLIALEQRRGVADREQASVQALHRLLRDRR